MAAAPARAVGGNPRRRRALKAVTVETRQQPSSADLGEVEAFADDLPEKFLHCREMGHNWRPFDAGRHRDGGFERTLRCVRCRTKRVQHLSADGMLIGSPKLIYPDGYLRQGLGRIDGAGRGILRLASMRRIHGDM